MTENAKRPDHPEGWQPLRGVKILDFSLLLPGPFATVALGDLGADVIKVEPPGGDAAREFRFPLFKMANRNKRSIILDLKRPEAMRVVERLTRGVDVAIEGFRPGVTERIGIDFASLSKINPRLIYCSLSGYGQNGPERLVPGHDLNYLSAAGAMVLCGHWLEPPRRSGLPVADLAAGAYAVIAILSAMHERERTGKGVYLDLSLAEAAMSFTAARHGFELDHVSRDHLWPTNDLFDVADGAVALGIVEEKFWTNFVAATRDLAPDLADEIYATEQQRRQHGDALSRRMREVLRTRTMDDWMQRFNQHDVPAQRVLTPTQTAESPQVKAREMVMERDGERHIPFPVWADGRRGAALHRVAPSAGADASAILADFDFTGEEIAELQNAGVLGARTSSEARRVS
jgi:crotonobetainyl-CoA:carnitine CoA-transferase CaiB-like acyl-CoA transferase